MVCACISILNFFKATMYVVAGSLRGSEKSVTCVLASY